MGAPARLRTWVEDVSHELALLPDTLRRLREGAVNFELVSQRLTTTSEALEQFNRVYQASLSDSARRYADATEAVRTQLERFPSPTAPAELFTSAVSELNKTIASLANVNPFKATIRKVDPPTDR